MIPHNRLKLTDLDREWCEQVLYSTNGYLGQGPVVATLERELTERFRPEGDAVCVSSGTAALYLAMSTLGLEDLSVSTYTCSAVWCAAELAGISTVKFLDIYPRTYRPHADRNVSEHTYGVLDPNRAIIEDMTHCPIPPAGELGLLSVCSLGPTKPLSAGAGGFVLGPKDLICEIRRRRDYELSMGGDGKFNWQMSDLHAAIGRSRLRRIVPDAMWRQETAEQYGATVGQIRFWYRYCLKTEFPRQVIGRLAARGVEGIIPLRYDELLHVQLQTGVSLPVAEELSKTLVSVPIWPGMTEVEVTTVADAIRQCREEGLIQ